MRVLVTCPPMLGMMEDFLPCFEQAGIEVDAPRVIQTLSESELKELVPRYDGWIIGDDPATREVFRAGRAGFLKAAVKWGVGTDNIDFDACRNLGIPIANTPGMFGAEVADIAHGYVIALARETFIIDRGVRAGKWPKPRGVSLAGKTAAIVGLGDIGSNIAKRLLVSGMNLIAYDPSVKKHPSCELRVEQWPSRIAEADFIVIACALTTETYHLFDGNTFRLVKKGVRIVNVARGLIIDELALDSALEAGSVYAAALDVFEVEPLPKDSPLRRHHRCIFGSHNASNTLEAVVRTSHQAIDKLFTFLGVDE